MHGQACKIFASDFLLENEQKWQKKNRAPCQKLKRSGNQSKMKFWSLSINLRRRKLPQIQDFEFFSSFKKMRMEFFRAATMDFSLKEPSEARGFSPALVQFQKRDIYFSIMMEECCLIVVKSKEIFFNGFYQTFLRAIKILVRSGVEGAQYGALKKSTPHSDQCSTTILYYRTKEKR